jgi:glycosyltransferase involved in cell wall biosynthesis
MRIALIASHAWPLPSPARTGDSQILLDLSRSLVEMGHQVDLFAPDGTVAPDGVDLRTMPSTPSRFEATPSAKDAELCALWQMAPWFEAADVIHDCSVEKSFHSAFPRRSLCTIWGGPWRHAHPPRNVVAQSHAQRDRLLRGATDYEGTDTPEMGGPNGTPLKDCRVVWNGIDTEAYEPTGKGKQDFFLMLGRWHPVRGIEQGIELAKATGINLLIAGTDPVEDHPAQAEYARRICELVRGHDNISVEFLPPDPEHHQRKVELYSDAKALLFLPQFQEPFGLSQIEAMACGTAVIAPDIGSCKEVLGVVGVEEGIKTLTEQVDGFPLEDFIAVQGRICRQRACEEFDRMTMAENYLGLYYDVLNGKGWG